MGKSRRGNGGGGGTGGNPSSFKNELGLSTNSSGVILPTVLNMAILESRDLLSDGYQELFDKEILESLSPNLIDSIIKNFENRFILLGYEAMLGFNFEGIRDLTEPDGTKWVYTSTDSWETTQYKKYDRYTEVH